jgi:hypothetical protein
MPNLRILLDVEDQPWTDLKDNPKLEAYMGENVCSISIGGLPRGMVSGLASVAIRLDLPDGRVILTETSMRLFLTAAKALAAIYGWPGEEKSA